MLSFIVLSLFLKIDKVCVALPDRVDIWGVTVNQRLQDLDPKRFPHLEKKWVGGSVDLDLLS
jgi:hypothetical protein